MILAGLLTLFATPPADAPARLVDGGICTGLAWIAVPADAKATVSEGPDFIVQYVDRDGKPWLGVYTGSSPMASADTGAPLVEIAGLSVRASHAAGRFQGYVVGNGDYLKNHFFGTAFKDDAGDATFFRNASFGAAAAAKCNKTGARQ